MFGVPAFFLDQEAFHTFPRLIARGSASVTSVRSLTAAIHRLPKPDSRDRIEGPSIEVTLQEIDRIAADYSRICSETAGDEVDRGERVIRECEAPCAA